MESYLSEESLWASGLASRLRLIQTNFADDSPATRQNYIAEEIDRALKAVVPSKRKSYLGALAERFPAWQAGPPAPRRRPKASSPGSLSWPPAWRRKRAKATRKNCNRPDWAANRRPARP